MSSSIPASPLTTFGISDNGQEQVATETASLALDQRTFLAVGESLAGAVLARPAAVLQQQLGTAHQDHRASSTDSAAPPSCRVKRASTACTWPKPSASKAAQLLEIRRRRAADLDLQLLSVALRRGIHLRPHQSESVHLRARWKRAWNSRRCAPTPTRSPSITSRTSARQSSHPDTNEYAAFLQDTIRVTNHFALSLGGRYDLQTFSTKGLVTNPLWPDSGQSALQPLQLRAPRRPGLFDRRPPAAGDSRRLRLVLHSHSADLQFDHRDRQRVSSQNLFLNNSNYLRPSDFSAISQSAGELSLDSVFLRRCPPAWRSSRKADISVVLPQFQNAESRAGQPEPGARGRIPLCGGRFLYVCPRRRPDPGAGREPSSAGKRALSCL